MGDYRTDESVVAGVIIGAAGSEDVWETIKDESIAGKDQGSLTNDQ